MPSRTLSEPEFDAIKAKVLESAPDGLDESGFDRYVGPAMASAIGEAENSREPLTGTALERFAKSAWSVLNPMGLVNAARHPIETAKGIVGAHIEEGKKAFKLSATLDPRNASEALGHAVAAVVPVVGPMAVHAGERIGEGDVAGGLGVGAGLLAPIGAKAARGPIGAATSAVGRGAEMLGKSPMVNRVAGIGAAGEAIYHGDLLKAATLAAAPTALKTGGKVLQFVGDKVSGAKPSVAAVLSDLELARAEVAAGRLPASILPALERAAAVKAAKAAPVAAGDVSVVAAPSGPLAEPIATPASTSPAGGGARPKSPQQILNEEALAARRAAIVKPVSVAAKELQTALTEAASKPKLTAPEMVAGLDMVRRGMAPEKALESIVQQRELARMLGLKSPTVAETRFPKGMRDMGAPFKR